MKRCNCVILAAAVAPLPGIEPFSRSIMRFFYFDAHQNMNRPRRETIASFSCTDRLRHRYNDGEPSIFMLDLPLGFIASRPFG